MFLRAFENSSDLWLSWDSAANVYIRKANHSGVCVSCLHLYLRLFVVNGAPTL